VRIGNPVEFRDEPVAVSGDEGRHNHCSAMVTDRKFLITHRLSMQYEALREGTAGRTIRKSEDLP